MTLGMLGAAAVMASLLLIRQQKEIEPKEVAEVAPGETVPGAISLERLRELGI